MHRLWERGVADLRPEQANHVERGGVLPIAFTLVHCIQGEDENGDGLLGAGPALWSGHAERIGWTDALPKRGTPMAEAERIRVGDMDAWRAYQAAVFARTEAALARTPLDRLAESLFNGPPPASMRGGFLILLTGEQGPVRVVDALEGWVYQHGLRHLGELEHARALVGLGGLS